MARILEGGRESGDVGSLGGGRWCGGVEDDGGSCGGRFLGFADCHFEDRAISQFLKSTKGSRY